ncbi:MAG: N-acyl homoserine lactonase family protein [Chloroflexales bacterium]|nr:N-acyl homoserine lactonase family protein [Chloroflexales bacterium]
MRLYLFHLGQTGSGSPAPGYLIQTDDGQNILIDTGYPRAMMTLASARSAVGAEPPPGSAAPRVTEADFIGNRLAAIGLSPADIHLLVSTHLDVDHAGNHDLFTAAELVIQREHYAAALANIHPRFAQTRAAWGHPALRYRQVDGDTVLVPGVELIATGGHVPGHQSVLVRLPETGPVLLTIDAIPRAAQLDPDTRTIGPFDMDEAGVRASTRRLNELIAREGVRLVIFGHDAERWETLRHAPEYYA